MLFLDDAAEVLSVTCTAEGTVTVTSLHPLPIQKGSTVLEAAKEWGCKLNGAAHAPLGVVAIVHDVSSTVQASGVIEYTMQVTETAPLAGAAVWDSCMAVHPPSASEGDAARRLISCADSIAAAQGSGFYLGVDCTTAGSGFGEYDFNYDRATMTALEPKLFIPGLTDVWFDQTFAAFTATFELQMGAYATLPSVDLPFFEAKFTATAEASITLMATESMQTTSIFSAISRAISSDSFAVSVGPLPVQGEATAQLVARKPSSSLSGITASVGASASATAELGMRYVNRREGGQGCYCVSECSGTFTFPSSYCFLNEACTASFVEPSRDGSFKWALCGSFPLNDDGWSLIAGGSWSFQEQPPTITSESGVTSGSSTYELGTKLGLTLYQVVPLFITPSYEVTMRIAPPTRALRQQGAPHGRALCTSQQTISGEVGKTNMESSVGDIAFTLPSYGQATLLSGHTSPSVVVNSDTVSSDPFVVCNADGTPATAPSAAGAGGGPGGSGAAAGASVGGDGGSSGTVVIVIIAVVAAVLIVGAVLFVYYRKKRQATTQVSSVPAPAADDGASAKPPAAPQGSDDSSAPVAGAGASAADTGEQAAVPTPEASAVNPMHRDTANHA